MNQLEMETYIELVFEKEQCFPTLEYVYVISSEMW